MLATTTPFLSAQQGKKGARAPASPAPAALRPFDVNSTTVHDEDLTDMRQLVRKFDVGPKGEFETTAQYAARARATAGTGEYYAVVMSGGNECTPLFRYSADSATMAFWLDARQVPEDYAGARSSVTIACASRRGKDYVGSNAYGAKVLVKQYLDSAFEVNAIGAKMGVINDVVIPMEPSIAQHVKQDLRVAAVFRPAADSAGRMVVQGSDYVKPTRDLPTEIVTDRILLNTDDVRFWVYNARSGEVYFRVPATSLRSKY
jgi:hypothetical protein